jgi:hypothetical protein
MDAASGRVWDGPCLGPGLGLGLGGSVPKQGHRRLVVEVSRRAGCRVSALMAAVGPMTGRSCVVRAAPTRMASSPMPLATSYVVDPQQQECLSAVCRLPSAVCRASATLDKTSRAPLYPVPARYILQVHLQCSCVPISVRPRCPATLPRPYTHTLPHRRHGGPQAGPARRRAVSAL